MWGKNRYLTVPIPAALSHTGEFRWDTKAVDSCIAPLVDAFNSFGLYTANSCCGHYKEPGQIILHDGRALELTDEVLKMSTEFEYPNCPRCGSSIDEHPADPCLDAWIAEAIFNCEPAPTATGYGDYFECTCPAGIHGTTHGPGLVMYSTQRGRAWELVDRHPHYFYLNHSNQWLRGYPDGPGGRAWVRTRGLGGKEMMWECAFGAPGHMRAVSADDAHAICLAALKRQFVYSHADRYARDADLPVCDQKQPPY